MAHARATMGAVSRRTIGRPTSRGLTLELTPLVFIIARIRSQGNRLKKSLLLLRSRRTTLAQWVFGEFRISISKQTLSRELRAVSFRKLSARPRHHAQDGWRIAESL